MNIKHKHIWTLLFFIYIIAVAYICFMDPEDVPTLRPELWGLPIDKIVHFIMFFPFPILAYESLHPVGKGLVGNFMVLALVFIIGLGLALATEYVQGLTGERTYEIKDFYADALGMTVSVLMTSGYIILFKNRK